MEPQALAAHMEALVGPCCRLTAVAALLMGRVRRLFFMSEHQDLSRFLVTNLGIIKYPQYRLQFFFMLPRHEVCEVCRLCRDVTSASSVPTHKRNGPNACEIAVQAESPKLWLPEAPGHAGV